MSGAELNTKWKKFYFVGGCAAMTSFVLTLYDIIFGSITSGDLSILPHTAIERFNEFQQSIFMGLYRLDFLNLISYMIMLFAYFAIVMAHRKENNPESIFAGLLAFLGTTIFISANKALAMLNLSNKYFMTSDLAQRDLFAAAGEAMLASGEHGGFGVFIGFFILTCASLYISIVMLRGHVFSRVNSILGIVGYLLLLVYIVLVTFIPSMKAFAVIIAAPGGLMALAWMFLLSVKLIKMSK